ncbi:MAG: glycine zipper 2TM domain-containing protein [Alphaproteobacteria bacterium]
MSAAMPTRRIRNGIGIGWLLMTVLVLAGCKQNVSPDSYSVGSVGQVNRSVRGTIISVRQINIEGTQGVGTAAGAAAGATGGSAIGGGTRENIIGAIGGAVVGGVAGAAIEGGATQQTGHEYVVQTQNGALLTLVQGDEKPFAMGEKVLVIYGTRSRIIRDPTANHNPSK